MVPINGILFPEQLGFMFIGLIITAIIAVRGNILSYLFFGFLFIGLSKVFLSLEYQLMFGIPGFILTLGGISRIFHGLKRGL